MALLSAECSFLMMVLMSISVYSKKNRFRETKTHRLLYGNQGNQGNQL
jgi:hypothetical protein